MGCWRLERRCRPAWSEPHDPDLPYAQVGHLSSLYGRDRKVVIAECRDRRQLSCLKKLKKSIDGFRILDYIPTSLYVESNGYETVAGNKAQAR